jgi:ribosome biogenesis GTPase / thiamine phosphate phosphatase
MIPHAFSALVVAPKVCGRIVANDRSLYTVETERGQYSAQMVGALRYQTKDPIDLPVVGDYVSLTQNDHCFSIDGVIPRTNLFARRGKNGSYLLQPIAANIDWLFVTVAVNRDFNVRRLERYVVAASAFGVPFAVALTKIDLVEDPESFISTVQKILENVPIVALSSLDKRGYEDLQRFCGPEKTIAFVGSSGVGKSTLINSLLDRPALEIGEIREQDGRGRHTTTRRLLLHRADGTAIIDTPGMREFSLAESDQGVLDVFQEITTIARECKYKDCRHADEPDCAVRNTVDESRLASWRKLEREAKFEARKTDRRATIAEKEKWKNIHKETRRRQRLIDRLD